MSGFAFLVLLLLLSSNGSGHHHHHHHHDDGVPQAQQLTPEQLEAQFRATMEFLQTSFLVKLATVAFALLIWGMFYIQFGGISHVYGAMISSLLLIEGWNLVIFVFALQCIVIFFNVMHKDGSPEVS